MISLLSPLISLQNRQKCRFEPTLKKRSCNKALRAKKPYFMRLLTQTRRPETDTKRPEVDMLTKRLEISCPAHTGPRVRIPYPPPTKNALLSTKTKVRFLNDVCLRQMMLASPMMTATPNDVWLCHILWQTSHHCETKWINIIFA